VASQKTTIWRVTRTKFTKARGPGNMAVIELEVIVPRRHQIVGRAKRSYSLLEVTSITEALEYEYYRV
jgi:hypothetical protein